MIIRDKICEWCKKEYHDNTKRAAGVTCSKKCGHALGVQKRKENGSYQLNQEHKEKISESLKKSYENGRVKAGIANPDLQKKIRAEKEYNQKVLKKRKETNIKKYGVEFPQKLPKIKDKIRQTCLEKYGCESPTQNDNIKNKIKQTNLEKYGVENVFQSNETKNKIKQTNLQRYGVENSSQNEEIKQKKARTTLKNFGVENPFQALEIKEKIKESNLEKYGVEHPLQSKEIKEKVKQTRIEKGLTKLVDGKTLLEWAKDENLASTTTLYRAQKQGIHPSDTIPHKSILEIKISQLLDELGVRYQNDKRLPEHKDLTKDYKRPDFLLFDYDLIIECDGEAWHKDEEKDKNRNEIYQSFGYNLICFSGRDILHNWEVVEQEILFYLIKKLDI